VNVWIDHAYISIGMGSFCGGVGYAPDGPPRLANSAPRGFSNPLGLPLAIPMRVVALEDELR